MTPTTNKRRHSWGWYLTACLVLALAALIYPVYVIRPFRHQGVHELAAGLFVLRFRPYVDVLLVLIALVSLVSYWRVQRRVLRRILAVAATILVCVAAWLSRINIYELMFHPMGRPSFSAASQSTLNGAEMVLTVNIGGQARAYPIRIISYHHIVNDTLNGVPIVATY